MSWWLDRANGFAAYARDTLAAAPRWPLRQALVTGATSVVLHSSTGSAVARYLEAKNAQDALNGLGDKAHFNC